MYTIDFLKNKGGFIKSYDKKFVIPYMIIDLLHLIMTIVYLFLEKLSCKTKPG